QLAVKVGLRLDDDAEGVYLKEAARKGAKIDWGARAVMFTTADIHETIAVMRKTAPAPQPLRPLAVNKAGREQRFLVGNGGNLLFDWDSWQAKAPTIPDMVELCHWANGADEVSDLFPVLLKGIDQRLAPIFNYALMGKYCRKKLWHEQPTEPIHVRYLDRMARVVERHRGYWQPMQEYEYINPPFRISQRAIRTMLARVDSGVCRTMGIGPMSVSGMTGPVTVAGLAVTAVAEILAGLTFFRILRPGFGLNPVVAVASLDLRTARVSFAGMHAALCNLAAWELVVRGLGVNSSCLTWYRDANEPGMQALYEFGMAQALFSSLLVYGTRPEIGGLCNGNMFSPHQAVMDIELVREFEELAYGFEASEEALGIEEIFNARFEQGVHITTDHTLKHLKDGVPFSRFLLRGLPGGAQHDKNRTQTDELMEKAAEAVNSAKRKGREMPPDKALGLELYEHVKQAAAELGIEAPSLP
ncbi:MAG: hypothetical protein FJ279_36390, partial [Planctomycetes bacterium]|nr:hypothetical protein [Planctomycetota bacterium]